MIQHVSCLWRDGLHRCLALILKGWCISVHRNVIGISLILAPFGQIGAAIVLAAQGSNRGWVPAHLLMLVSIFLYFVVVVGVRQLLGIRKGIWVALGDGAMLLALGGLFFTVSQITIDLAVGLLASTPVAMDHMFGQIRAFPIIEYTVYTVGPSLFFLGFLLLILLLGRFRAIPAWSAGVAGAGIVLGVVGKAAGVLPPSILAVVTLGCVWVAFLPTAGGLLTNK